MTLDSIEETARAWSDSEINNPAEAISWIRAGFDCDGACAWVDPRATPALAKRLQTLGWKAETFPSGFFDSEHLDTAAPPSSAVSHDQAGLAPYLELVIDSAPEPAEILESTASPTQTEPRGRATFDELVTAAILWRELGFEPDEVEQHIRHGASDPQFLAEVRRLGFDPRTIDLDTAQAMAAGSIDLRLLDRADRWRQHGFEGFPDIWITNEFDPRQRNDGSEREQMASPTRWSGIESLGLFDALTLFASSSATAAVEMNRRASGG